MRYLCLYRAAAGEEGGLPDPEHMAAMGRLVEEMTAKGSLLGTEPLGLRADSAIVIRTGESYVAADVEGRMSGYAIIQAADKDEAIALCKTFLAHAGDGSSEIRPILEFGPQP